MVGKSKWLKKQVPAFTSGLVTMLAVVNGVPAVIDKLSPDSPTDQQAGAPPEFYVTAGVRASEGRFVPFLAGLRPGNRFQVFVGAVNNGGSDATRAELRAAIDGGLEVIHGSCRIRTSDHRHQLRQCKDNFARGGFSFERFGRGSWAQVYFNVLVPQSVAVPMNYTVTAVGDTDATTEDLDRAFVSIRSA